MYHTPSPNTTIETTQAEIVKEFSMFDDWSEKYEYIIERGMDLPELDEAHKIPEKRVQGCQSAVWLNSRYENGRLYFEADSDSTIVKGLISMLIDVYSGHTPEDIVKAPLTFMGALGFDKHLSSTRANGLASMVQKIKQDAASKLG